MGKLRRLIVGAFLVFMAFTVSSCFGSFLDTPQQPAAPTIINNLPPQDNSPLWMLITGLGIFLFIAVILGLLCAFGWWTSRKREKDMSCYVQALTGQSIEFLQIEAARSRPQMITRPAIENVRSGK